MPTKKRRSTKRPARRHTRRIRAAVPALTAGVPEAPPDLIKAVAAGECVLYAGAGFSARAGLPTWFRFVEDLLAWSTSTQHIDRGFAESLREALRSDPDLVADSIMSRLTLEPEDPTDTSAREISPDLVDYLRGVFLKKGQPTASHHRLKRLNFAAALTTNLDELMEATFSDNKTVYTHEDADALLATLTRQDFYVLKLYGTLDRPSSIILAPAQYRAAVIENRLYARYMEGLFASKTILFVGASLKGILDYMSGFRFGAKVPREHYAIVDVRGSAWKVNADALHRHYGIKVIPYTASPDFPEIDAFLDRLAADARKAGAPAAFPATSDRALLIEGVELTNIGPFDTLSLDFRENWNLLLGDNGVGKSSVLKAIAVALSGTESKEYAGRLIKSERSSAIISIRTPRQRYVTELYRTDSEAEMKVPPTSPLSVEGWLAMGFPPLRALTWNRSEETLRAVGQPRPVAADLLPLVKAEFDPRVDRLKGWLMDLHRQERTAPPDVKARLRLQREKLFEVIAALTPDLVLKDGGLGSDRHQEVCVITDDGRVPIEAVSQGTSSLIGWIGVLVQRLFDVYHDRPKPWLEPALVLIDEVDAHMHPKWQRTLARALERVFPKLQIIATTHSPLMVPGLDPDHVIVFKRNRKKVTVERQTTEMRGYRADQVLTSRLFGLQSSLSPETEEDLKEYRRLAALERRKPKDQKDLEELAQRLEVRLPSASEREEARVAYDMLKESLEERVAAIPVDERENVVAEMRLQLEEAITGSRRPS